MSEQIHHSSLFNTYSIVARDPATGAFGVAVQTHQMCVGHVVPWLLPGVGAVATQSLVNVSFGPLALAMLREGLPAEQVVAALVASDPQQHRRQVAVVDAEGRAAAHTGSGCIAEAAHHVGTHYSVQANMMTNPTVVSAMARAFEATSGDLAARMIAAMQAAEAEGGDIRGQQSAALIIVPGGSDQPDWAREYDLRVDEHPRPVDELARLVQLRRAALLDDRGYRALKDGDRTTALELWQQARDLAPELEELPFWQAVTLADEHEDIATAVDILKPVLDQDARQEHWVDLVQRLMACGLIEHEDRGKSLLQALQS